MDRNEFRVPTAEEIATDRSTVVGRFTYPDRDDPMYHPLEGDFDEGLYIDDCTAAEDEMRATTALILSDHGIDMTHAEVRLSEMEPGEIRIYWPTQGSTAEHVAAPRTAAGVSLDDLPTRSGWEPCRRSPGPRADSGWGTPGDAAKPGPGRVERARQTRS